MQTPPNSRQTRQASELLAAHLALIGKNIPAWLELFTEDAVIEFPYAPTIGTPERLEGRAAIFEYMKDVPQRMQGLTFTNLRVHSAQDPRTLIAEVHGSATIAATGLRYEQDYVMFLETDGERIIRYREYWNPMPGIRAFGGAEGVRQSFEVGGQS